MTEQAAQTPSEVFGELRQWWQIHEGFGLSYVFSDDVLGMTWLRQRIHEALKSAQTAPTLVTVDSLDALQSFLQVLSLQPLSVQASAAPDLGMRNVVWIAPALAQSHAVIQRLNEMRQLLLRSPHLYLICLPSRLALDAARLASDLWSVRSLVLSAQGQNWHAQRSHTWTRELGDARPATSSASTPTIQAWNHHHAQWLTQAGAPKRSRVSLQMGQQAMADAIALRQFQQAQTIGTQILAHAKAQANDVGCANAHLLLGNLDRRLGKIDSARAHYIQAIILFEKEQADLGHANALWSLGNLDLRLGRIDSARTLYTQAIALYEKEQNDLGRANTLQSLGELDHRLGQVDSARARYTQAIALHEKEQDDLGRANALQSLGDLDSRMGRINSARTLYTQAITLYEKQQDDLGRANALQSLGYLDSCMGQVDSARTLYTQAIALFEKEQNDLGRANALRSMGDLDRHLGQVDSARAHYTQAIALFEKEQNAEGLAYTWASLARLNTPLDTAMTEKSKAYALQSASPLVINDIATLLENHPLTH